MQFSMMVTQKFYIANQDFILATQTQSLIFNSEFLAQPTYIQASISRAIVKAFRLQG